MAIRSHSFGRVTLTNDDAAKFNRQVRYGRASPAAAASVQRGVDMAAALQRDGKVKVSIRKPANARERSS